MLKDRVYGITQTMFHAPYSSATSSAPRSSSATATTSSTSQANYLVHPHQAEPAVSRCSTRDATWTRSSREDGKLKFKEKLCIFDSELIPNSIIYPI